MAANKKPRKKYRPKPVLKDTVSYVLTGLKQVPNDIRTNLKISVHMAMSTIARGHGERIDWENVAESLNMALVLCEMGYGHEYTQQIRLAQRAMMNLRVRLKEKGRMVFTAPELTAVNEALAIHEAQIDSPSLIVIDVEKAVAEVRKRLKSREFVKPGDMVPYTEKETT
jgi:hypothetical protein